MKQRLDIKPLSVNQAFTGRRFATEKYKKFKTDISYLLKPCKIPICDAYRLTLTFGLSSPLSDGDNCIKQTQDALADKYGFNDKKIREWHVYAKKVSKGQEFIEFELEPLVNNEQSEYFE